MLGPSQTVAAATGVSPRPARRQAGPPAGYQHWRRLFFAHWPVDRATLRPLVPQPLAIDEYEGSAYLSLTPFVVKAARPFGAPPALGLRFLETNVRTYVRLPGGEPGVYFFSLDAASLLAVTGARVGLGLPYFWATGRERPLGSDVDYSLHRRGSGVGCHVRYRVGGYLGHAAPGTLDHFLIERYLLHVRRGPSLWTVRVRHRPYPLYATRLLGLDDGLARAAGVRDLGQPARVHFAAGVDVAVCPPRVRLGGPRRGSP
jgi:uncharacterized protein YqjF (DUF2071 family)